MVTTEHFKNTERVTSPVLKKWQIYKNKLQKLSIQKNERVYRFGKKKKQKT